MKVGILFGVSDSFSKAGTIKVYNRVSKIVECESTFQLILDDKVFAVFNKETCFITFLNFE